MDPAPAYDEESFETQIAEVNKLVSKIGDTFPLAKLNFRKLDETINDPHFKTEHKFTEIQDAFVDLAMNSCLSASSAAGNIDAFITMSSDLLNDETKTIGERAKSLERLTSILKTNSEKSLQQSNDNTERLQEQVDSLESLLARIDTLVKEHQAQIRSRLEGGVEAVEVAPRPSNETSLAGNGRVSPLPTNKLISKWSKLHHTDQGSRTGPILQQVTRYKPKPKELGWPTVDVWAFFPELESSYPEPSSEKKVTESKAKLEKVLSTLENLEASHSSLTESIGHLIADLKGLASSLGDFSGLWMLIISHAEELEEYVRKGGSINSEQLLTRFYSELEIYHNIKESLVAYSLSA